MWNHYDIQIKKAPQPAGRHPRVFQVSYCPEPSAYHLDVPLYISEVVDALKDLVQEGLDLV